MASKPRWLPIEKQMLLKIIDLEDQAAAITAQIEDKYQTMESHYQRSAESVRAKVKRLRKQQSIPLIKPTLPSSVDN